MRTALLLLAGVCALAVFMPAADAPRIVETARPFAGLVGIFSFIAALLGD